MDTVQKNLKLFFLVCVGMLIGFGSHGYSAEYEREFNDTQATSLFLDSIDVQVIGNFWHPLDYDWYAFNVEGSVNLRIAATYEDSESEDVVSDALFIEIRDKDNIILGDFSVDFGPKKSSYVGNVRINGTGTYYLVVFCPVTGNYQRDKYKISLANEDSTDPTDNLDKSEPAYIALSLSQTSVKSDNVETADVTATVLDGYRAPIEEVELLVSIDAGQISEAFPVTDEEGKAVVQFSSGLEKSNDEVLINVSVVGSDPEVSAEIPIVITGSTLEVDPGLITNLELGGNDSTNLTVTAKDAAGNPIVGASISVKRDASISSGLIFFSNDDATESAEGVTDSSGSVVFPIQALAQGDVVLNISGVGVTATQNYSIYSLGDALRIVSPDQENFSLSIYNYSTSDIDDDEGIFYKVLKVTVPELLVEQSHTIRFVATMGDFSPTTISNGAAVPVVPLAWSQILDVPAADEITIAYQSDEAGISTIYVYDVNSIVQNDSVTATISAPVANATQISLQAEPTIVSPSSGNVENVSDLIVTVKDESDQVVGGATVVFRIVNPTGGGETISPVWTVTDDNGVARSTFKSGSLPSGGEGVEVVAEVLGADATNLTDSIWIVIGGTPGSIVIGRSTTISSDDTNTQYILPMSILVSDAGGHPVANQEVSLNNWPVEYATGTWVESNDELVPDHTGWFPNEDYNRNTILDPWESDPQNNGITPPNSSAGNIPNTVTTDENGVANFELVYLKHFVPWVRVEVRATTIVSGTETISELTFILPWLIGEEESLSSSPFNW